MDPIDRILVATGIALMFLAVVIAAAVLHHH